MNFIEKPSVPICRQTNKIEKQNYCMQIFGGNLVKLN